MASIQSIDFHNEKMAQERARVMLRIANGLKSDSSALIGRRMMNRTYQGVPDNSTGSRNMPFFATKNELNTPLEAKIAARGGMMPGLGLELPAGIPRAAQTQAPRNVASIFQPEGRYMGLAPPFPRDFSSLAANMDLPAARRVVNAQIANAVEPLPPQPVAPAQVLPRPPVLMPFAQQGTLQLAPHTIVANQRDANPNVIAAPFFGTAPRSRSPVERMEGRGMSDEELKKKASEAYWNAYSLAYEKAAYPADPDYTHRPGRDEFVIERELAAAKQVLKEYNKELDKRGIRGFNPRTYIGKGEMSGGVLRDYRYARKILDQRKMDIENQLREEEGMPRELGPLTQLSELDSRKLELANQLQFFVGATSQGDYTYLSSLDGKQLLRNVIALGPALTQDELVDIVRIMQNLLDDLSEGLREHIEGIEDLEDVKNARSKQRGIYFSITAIEQVIGFLKKMAAIVNNSLQDKMLVAKEAAKELGSAVGLKEVNKQLSEVRGAVERTLDIMAANLYSGDDYGSEGTYDTSSFASGPTSSSARASIPPSMAVSEEPAETIEREESEAPAPSVRPSPLGPAAQRLQEHLARKAEQKARFESLLKANDIAGLQQLLREVAPLRRSEKYFGPGASKTILKNVLLNYL